MPSENTILNLFRRPFSFFNNSTSHYRLRTRRQKNCAVSPTETTSWSNTASPTDWYSATNTIVTTPWHRYATGPVCRPWDGAALQLLQVLWAWCRGGNQNLIGLDGGDNLYLFAFNSQIWADALGLPKAPWGKGSFDSWFDSANVSDIRKVMADPNTKNAIPNALRNGGGCWGI